VADESYAFRPSQRLSGRRAFAAVYAIGVKYSRGPLLLYSKPNQLPQSRWGLSVSRRVGGAVRRNRIKRLLRESIRLLQHDLPAGYDLIIVVQPHEPMALAKYQELLSGLTAAVHTHWTRDDSKIP
jgi:ribonuclease P protein component